MGEEFHWCSALTDWLLLLNIIPIGHPLVIYLWKIHFKWDQCKVAYKKVTKPIYSVEEGKEEKGSSGEGKPDVDGGNGGRCITGTTMAWTCWSGNFPLQGFFFMSL